MNAVFADTFYWAALTNIDDPANGRALNISRSLAPDGIVTTDEVLSEYLAFFAGASSAIRDRAGRNVAALLDNLEVSHRVAEPGVIPFRSAALPCASRQGLQSGRLYLHAEDAREGLRDVLTNDRHFEQEGFRALFRN